MSIILLVTAFLAIATAVVFVVIAKGKSEPTVASMLRSQEPKGDARR